jgi:general secretion pathway protein F
VREGEGLAVLLHASGLFPPFAVQLTRVGEETGKLDEMLLHQAGLFERNAQRTIERLLSALVPGLTITLGVLVAGIVASILLAILKINDLAL